MRRIAVQACRNSVEVALAKKKSAAGETDGTAQAAPYVVLARKYRPRTFDDLIGQGAMVQTLRNAFASGRIAQAYMLTGVRGVGKTTTARILARALNYERDGIAPDAQGPSIDLQEIGKHCTEIMESRHPDVLEMDAASNTGVDDVREIIENARYKPIMARAKVFIIDEVHMLSKNAFNALLKTLEEPPAHAKFIFATTEIRKVPITVLSRCQRFDLRRVDVPEMAEHFKGIVAKEGAKADAEALALIARAAEGSVRDGLSILDQAIAMGSGNVNAGDVRTMLGLADRGRILDLLELVLSGKAGPALEALAALHKDGADPMQALGDLAEAVHLLTRVKIGGAAAAGDGIANAERARLESLSRSLSIAILSRAWQMLVKGAEEADRAGNPLAATEMVLIRLSYTADLPSPDDVLRTLGGGGPGREPGGPRPSPVATGRDQEPRGPLNRDTTPPPVLDAIDSVEAPPPPWEAYEQDMPILSADEVPFDEDLAEADADIGPAIVAPPEPQRAVVTSFQDVVDLAGRKRDARLKVHLEEHVSLVSFDAQGSIELHLLTGAPKELGNDLREKLNAWTGKRWTIALGPRAGHRPIGEAQRQQAAAELQSLKEHPAVAEVLREFPDAKIATVRPLKRTKPDSKAG
jgi:DNA polymerase-3 subunit gamma/tau